MFVEAQQHCRFRQMGRKKASRIIECQDRIGVNDPASGGTQRGHGGGCGHQGGDFRLIAGCRKVCTPS
ncbi:hypothetical protein [Chelativorans xinjiangense]|uniref:hypothetical protein n=1 Tax=Chelativorans xinjiangense TaxID=2681485 RepID=UPI00135AFCB2|nr:hypothetical protein [Chelativorans xinjiangense]